MLFTDPVFLYYFLPLLLIAYYVLPDKFRNFLLLLASLAFYAWGEGRYVLVLLISICWNYLLGLIIGRLSKAGPRLATLTIGIAANLLMLVAFKYSNFLAENARVIMESMGLPSVGKLGHVYMPIGISFFTFQAISYLIDVYRADVAAQRNLLDYAMYKAFFPQLIAGPIIRYADVALQIKHRVVSGEQFAMGVRRFVGGLGKKMIVANTVAFTADQIFSFDPSSLTTTLAWLGIVCYSVQIYFDFSGYSDMAIGLGKMFGFDFLENFNYPYISTSITDFWRRWHISLSSWFRDYLYIPLGGNRRSPLRTYFNLLTVFFLCGLWHGASWNFIVWGLFHGGLLVAERLFLRRVLDAAPVPFKHAYALLAVMVGWVFFRTETLADSVNYLRMMFGLAGQGSATANLWYFLSPKLCVILVAAAVFSMPTVPFLGTLLGSFSDPMSSPSGGAFAGAFRFASNALLVLVLLTSMALIAAGSYNPFIYFRF
ncbi:MBOAT family O-acyltransferase [Tundrisphaera lichenicola]|uniref:MBOAT family O-acyltransferase n=1 Tax=Tundrisphaera lichenicola TaxID=2029860 RepID=UPI003EBBF5EE